MGQEMRQEGKLWAGRLGQLDQQPGGKGTKPVLLCKDTWMNLDHLGLINAEWAMHGLLEELPPEPLDRPGVAQS